MFSWFLHQSHRQSRWTYPKASARSLPTSPKIFEGACAEVKIPESQFFPFSSTARRSDDRKNYRITEHFAVEAFVPISGDVTDIHQRMKEWKQAERTRETTKIVFFSFDFFARAILSRRSREFAGGLFWPVNSLITAFRSLTMSQNCGRRRKQSKLLTKRPSSCKSTITPSDSHCSRAASFRRRCETPTATFFVFSARE